MAALSATLANPEGFREWLAPLKTGDESEIEAVAMVEGEVGAPAEVEILLPDEELRGQRDSLEQRLRQARGRSAAFHGFCIEDMTEKKDDVHVHGAARKTQGPCKSVGQNVLLNIVCDPLFI